MIVGERPSAGTMALPGTGYAPVTHPFAGRNRESTHDLRRDDDWRAMKAARAIAPSRPATFGVLKRWIDTMAARFYISKRVEVPNAQHDLRASP